MSVFLLPVREMAIFAPRLAAHENDAHMKVLYYYPHETTINDRDIHIGVLETIAAFGRGKAGTDVSLIETNTAKICLLEPEEGLFISITIPKPPPFSPDDPMRTLVPGLPDVPDIFLRRIPLLMYEMLSIFTGPVLAHAERHGIHNTRRVLIPFGEFFRGMLERSGLRLHEMLGSVPYMPLTPKQGLQFAAFVERLKIQMPDARELFLMGAGGGVVHAQFPPTQFAAFWAWATRHVPSDGNPFRTAARGLSPPADVDRLACALLPPADAQADADDASEGGDAAARTVARLPKFAREFFEADIRKPLSHLQVGQHPLRPPIVTMLGPPSASDGPVAAPFSLPVWLHAGAEGEGPCAATDVPIAARFVHDWGQFFSERSTADGAVWLRRHQLVIFDPEKLPLTFFVALDGGASPDDVAAAVFQLRGEAARLQTVLSKVAPPPPPPADALALLYAMTGASLGGIRAVGWEFATFSPLTLQSRSSIPELLPAMLRALDGHRVRDAHQRSQETRADPMFRQKRLSLYQGLSAMLRFFSLMASRPEFLSVCSTCPCGDPGSEGTEAFADTPGQSWVSARQALDSTLCFALLDGSLQNIVDACARVDELAIEKL